MPLLEQLEATRLVDHHAHNLLPWEDASSGPYSGAFTEGCHPQVEGEWARHLLAYRRSLKDMARLLECPPTEEYGQGILRGNALRLYGRGEGSGRACEYPP